jgi:ElaA protein
MNVNYSIKKFEDLTAIEVYDMLKLRADVFVIEQQCIYQDCDDKDKTAFHLLGFYEHTLVAYCRLLDEGISYSGYSSIGRVLTHIAFRNKQIGKELMQRAIDFSLKNFSFPIKISAQAYLEKFYTELGFTTVSEIYLEDDIPHIAMIYKQ